MENKNKNEDKTYDNKQFEILLSRNSDFKQSNELKTCLQNGHSVNHMNQGKAAINFAAESMNFCNLLLLLHQDEKVKNLNHQFKQQTPLNYLAKVLNNQNFDEVSECMKLLIYHGAAVNIPDRNNLVPLNYVLRNNDLDSEDKYKIVYTLLMEYTETDYIVVEAWNYIKKYRKDKHLELNQILDNIKQPINPVAENSSEIYKAKVSYILHLVSTNEVSAIKMVLQTFYINSDEENKIIICQSMYFADIKYFELMLESRDLKLDSVQARILLEEVINKMPSETSEKYSNYLKCFQILLKTGRVDVSAVNEMGIPLLSHAAKLGNDTAVREMLLSGAYVGRRSDYTQSPLANIRPMILEEHFNQCITVENVHTKDNNISLNLFNVSHSTSQDNLTYNDLRAITFIRRSTELYHLLQHPVINSLLLYKGHQYSVYYYTHLVLYLFFQLLIILHITYRFPIQTEDPGLWITPALWLFILYLVLRELVNLYLGWQHYLENFLNNLLDVSIIGLSVVTCAQWYSKETQSIIAICVLLATLLKLLILLSMMPFKYISTPIIMLLCVVKTVIKNSIILAYLLFSFSLCFHLRFSEADYAASANNTDNTKISFDNLYSSFTKTFFMSTGEYDHGNINTKSGFDFILLILFGIFFGISFMNYLIGEAVSDIQKIKEEAQTNKSSRQINFLVACDVFLHSSLLNHWIFDKLKPKISPMYQSVFKITIPQYEYPHRMTLHCSETIQPLKGKLNETALRVESSTTTTNESTAMINRHFTKTNVNNFSTTPNWLSNIKRKIKSMTFIGNQVDDEFVNRALSIVEKNRNDKSQPDNYENRLLTIENDIKQIGLQNQKMLKCIHIIQENVNALKLASETKIL